MKKFRFSLEKLKDFREQELDRQKNTLAALQAELRGVLDEIEELKKQLAVQDAELSKVSAAGASAYDIALRKRYIVTIQADIHLKEQQAARKQNDINRQLDVVVEATKDVRTMEKLEEKQLEEYKFLENKENEQFIEEFVSTQSARAPKL
ncbi:MAG: flagellar export protein FliJ [Oscillospiraceae bacterium]|nr:flagellar export protein FliJ [Oscillospiraceae bacterium]